MIVIAFTLKTVCFSMSQCRFQRYMLNNFLAVAQIPKIVLKSSFSNDRYRQFARGACTAANDAPYDRPLSSLSNRVSRIVELCS